jgi:RNase P subunit RPR2
VRQTTNDVYIPHLRPSYFFKQHPGIDMDRASKLNQSLLSNNTTTVKLQIKESASIYGGLGLVAIGNISAAEDIFFKKQMLIVADDNHLKTTCDNCFMWLGGEIGANGRLRAARDAETVLKRCNSCKVVRYCSKVSICIVIPRFNFLNISAYGLCGSLVNGQPGNTTTKLNA